MYEPNEGWLPSSAKRCANSSQEADGLDIPSLFDNAKDVLEELNSMKEDPEIAADAVPINSELIPELNQLSQIARAELNCKCHITRSLLPSILSSYIVSSWVACCEQLY